LKHKQNLCVLRDLQRHQRLMISYRPREILSAGCRRLGEPTARGRAIVLLPLMSVAKSRDIPI
jgi:hypothetical protein